jgi:hypothetical protein
MGEAPRLHILSRAVDLRLSFLQGLSNYKLCSMIPRKPSCHLLPHKLCRTISHTQFRPFRSRSPCVPKTLVQRIESRQVCCASSRTCSTMCCIPLSWIRTLFVAAIGYFHEAEMYAIPHLFQKTQWFLLEVLGASPKLLENLPYLRMVLCHLHYPQ